MLWLKLCHTVQHCKLLFQFYYLGLHCKQLLLLCYPGLLFKQSSFFYYPGLLCKLSLLSCYPSLLQKLSLIFFIPSLLRRLLSLSLSSTLIMRFKPMLNSISIVRIVFDFPQRLVRVLITVGHRITKHLNQFGGKIECIFIHGIVRLSQSTLSNSLISIYHITGVSVIL